ncbi:MAG: BamA/TamA family outer membrane protein [Clostridium sp.]|nr:BamA/TamA family outer membrane protein [Clostridium sp.]
MRATRRLKFITTTGLMLLTVQTSFARPEQTDSATTDSANHRSGLIQRVIDYFAKANVPKEDGKIDISVIGGPHYSSEEKFGIGLVAAAHYGKTITDGDIDLHSDVALYSDFTTSGSVKIGINGTHIFPEDRRRIPYDISFAYEPSRYWGVGFEYGKFADRYTKYKRLSLNFQASYQWRVRDDVFVGPSVTVRTVASNRIANREIWNGQTTHTASMGAGITLTYDSRDNMTAPRRGTNVGLTAQTFPQLFGNATHSFLLLEGYINHYRRFWHRGILAMRFHASMSCGETPWTMMPTFGGSSFMRGYFDGRFIDKNEMDLTVELRQRVFRRSGVALWVGAATVFPKFSSMRIRRILPNAGIGYRWEFKRNTNVRIDFGFGRGETGFVFNINEAF